MTKPYTRGQIAVELLFLSAIVVILIAGFVSLATSLLQVSVRSENKLQAFAIAEAGIQYYQWHLEYAPQDFTDNTGHAGPYVHPYYDANGNQIGQFSLAITPPPSGSTVVTITSTGSVLADASVQKVIQVRMGIPSLAKYAWAINQNIYFGTSAEVFGTIYSDAGVRMDGVAHNLVESALTTFQDPSNGNQTEWAVYTTQSPADPQPPTPYPSHPSVFMAGRAVGVPALDFTGITQDLAAIKSAAQASGTYFGPSSAYGYDLLLSNASYTIYKVTALATPSSHFCNNNTFNQSGWGLWSVKTESVYATGTIPQNGNMFFEDNLWVRGTINGVRATIASGRFPANPSTYSNIVVNNSLNYTHFDGTDALALIAQGDVLVGYASDNNLMIDGAVIAQNGEFGRYYYSSYCGSSYVRNLLTTLGTISTGAGVATLGFAYSPTSGYQSRDYNYDPNLLYAPPPSFPLTTDQYSLISWAELQ